MPKSLSKEKNGSAEGKARKKSGIPTGNAGEYFVMGELLRRGYDAQLADRNTKGYDVLVGRPEDPTLRKLEVKTVRAAPWYVRPPYFKPPYLDRVTIYVLLGKPQSDKPIRFFLAKNRDLKKFVHQPPNWKQHGLISLKVVEQYENRWDVLFD